MYKLTSQDITNVCGPGGGWTTTNWIKYFKHLSGAKKYASADYGQTIHFEKQSDHWYSGDLRYVDYTIEKVETED